LYNIYYLLEEVYNIFRTELQKIKFILLLNQPQKGILFRVVSFWKICGYLLGWR